MSANSWLLQNLWFPCCWLQFVRIWVNTTTSNRLCTALLPFFSINYIKYNKLPHSLQLMILLEQQHTWCICAPTFSLFRWTHPHLEVTDQTHRETEELHRSSCRSEPHTDPVETEMKGRPVLLFLLILLVYSSRLKVEALHTSNKAWCFGLIPVSGRNRTFCVLRHLCSFL